MFAVAVDLEDYPEWVADLKSVAVTERDDDGTAARGHVPRGGVRPVLHLLAALRLHRAPKLLSWVMVEGDLTSKLDGSYRFEATEGGTLVTYQLEVELRVPIPGFVKQRAAQRIQGTALRELKARAESLA